MPKLRHPLKETPEESAEREWRRKKRKERRDRRALRHETSSSTKHHRAHRETPSHYDSGEGWTAPAGSTKVDKDSIRAKMEESRHMERLFNAMEDDDRLDSLEAHFNSYVPPRWSQGSEDQRFTNPDEMTEYEYAEWIREGMWRRTHKAEMEERDRAQREERARQFKLETKRLEREAQAEKVRKQAERERKAMVKSYQTYADRWKTLLSPTFSSALAFDSIPWPVYPSPTDPLSLTRDAISTFLFSEHYSEDTSRKHRLREALRLYHPDRFMGKWMPLVRQPEQAKVEDGIGRVVRIMNSLMEDVKDS